MAAFEGFANQKPKQQQAASIFLSLRPDSKTLLSGENPLLCELQGKSHRRQGRAAQTLSRERHGLEIWLGVHPTVLYWSRDRQ